MFVFLPGGLFVSGFAELLGAIGLVGAIVACLAWYRARTNYRQLLTAVDTMTQGLVMYDGRERLVLHNRRYLELYGLSPDTVKPGVRLIDVLRHRRDKFNLSADPGAYRSELMRQLARGETTTMISDSGSGRLISVHNRPLRSGGWVGTHEDVTEQIEKEKHRESLAEQEARRARIENEVVLFRSQIESLLGVVARSAGTMQATAEALLANSDRASERAEKAVGESNRSSESAHTAAAAAEELSASINEISRQLERTTREVSAAADVSRSTNAEIATLADAAQKIGDVVELIRDVAGQTNLLALNATIEAARAGAAGRGFAVVASEVKSLAVQTGRATEEIAGQIQAVQASARDAVEAIGRIAQRMGEINSSTASVAASVEQQNSATAQILHNVARAAEGAHLVSAVLAEVAGAASDTRHSAQTVSEASKSVDAALAKLRIEVAGFLDKVAV